MIDEEEATWQGPMKIARKSKVSSQQNMSTNTPSCTPRALTDSVLSENETVSVRRLNLASDIVHSASYLFWLAQKERCPVDYRELV